MLTAVAIVASERHSIINRSNASGNSLVDWFQSSDFNVSAAQNGFEITPHQPDQLSSSIASDTARLLLAGRETLWSIEKARSEGSIHPAWSSIQAYYAAFYYASAMFRILGQPNSYFQANELAQVRNLLNAQGTNSLPGSGLYEMRLATQGNLLSATRQNSGGTHEAVWSAVRDYVSALKSRLTNYAQFSSTEQSVGTEQLDNLASATSGLGQQHNLSTARNAVQYRQQLSCWHPIPKRTKRYHETDKVGQTLGDDFLISPASDAKQEYSEFSNRCFTICGFVHQLAIEISSQSPMNSPTGRYRQYHQAL